MFHPRFVLPGETARLPRECAKIAGILKNRYISIFAGVTGSVNPGATIIWHTERMQDESPLTLRQIDQLANRHRSCRGWAGEERDFELRLEEHKEKLRTMREEWKAAKE